MGEIRTLGGILEPSVGGAVYEVTSAHKALTPWSGPSVDDSALDSTAVLGPLHWTALTNWEGHTAADLAMQKAVALHNLDKQIVKPLFAKGRRRRDRVFPKGTPNPYRMIPPRRSRGGARGGRVWDRVSWALLFASCVLLVSSGLSVILLNIAQGAVTCAP